MDLNEMKTATVAVLSETADVYDQDAVLEEMFSKGIPFGKLKSLYRSVGVAEGFLADPAEVKENIANAVEESDIEGFENYDQVEELASSIAGDIDGAQETAVIRAIKTFCKDNDIDVPAKTKSAGRAGGGTTGKAIVDYFNATPIDQVTKRGMYDAVLPVVKGPRNAYDNVNMHFLNIFAVKSGKAYDEAIAAVKAMPALDLSKLQKEFDGGSAPATDPVGETEVATEPEGEW